MLDEEAIVALNSLFGSKEKLAGSYISCIEFLKRHGVL